jgi:RNA polymerase sigma factor (sigma-70 family)
MAGNGVGLGEIEVLYRQRFEQFRRLAFAIVRERELSVEVVQEAFAAAIRSRRGFRGDGPLEAWLCRIVVNEARRAAGRRPDAELLESAPEPSQNGSAASGELRAPIAALPERQRLALFLRYYADLDYRGIATALGVEVGTVSATLHAAHAALREALEEVER